MLTQKQLAAIIWGSVFSNDLILFSVHPVCLRNLSRCYVLTVSQLLNSAAMLFFVQGILILQPTHTAKQKKQGTYTHAALNDVALSTAIAGLVVIGQSSVELYKHDRCHGTAQTSMSYMLTFEKR